MTGRQPWSALVPQHGMASMRWLARWRPQPPPWWVVPLLSVLVAVQGVNRGLDLVRSPASRLEIFAFVELLGQNAWGWSIFAASGFVLLSVLGIRTVWAVISAHALACGVFAGYAIALAQGLAESGATAGTRFVGAPIVTAIFYALWTYLLVLGMRAQHQKVSDLDREGEAQ